MRAFPAKCVVNCREECSSRGANSFRGQLCSHVQRRSLTLLFPTRNAKIYEIPGVAHQQRSVTGDLLSGICMTRLKNGRSTSRDRGTAKCPAALCIQRACTQSAWKGYGGERSRDASKPIASAAARGKQMRYSEIFLVTLGTLADQRSKRPLLEARPFSMGQGHFSAIKNRRGATSKSSQEGTF